jgi:hypothetical protein
MREGYGSRSVCECVSRGGYSHRRCVQSRDRGQDAVKRSRHFLGIGQTVKRCFWALSPALLGGQEAGPRFCACAVKYSQRVKGKNPPWSSGQGHFSTVKNLDPGRSSGHSAYGSNRPLVCVSVTALPAKYLVSMSQMRCCKVPYRVPIVCIVWI